MELTFDDLNKIINIKNNLNPSKTIFIGISGIPGAGKSFFTEVLRDKLSSLLNNTDNKKGIKIIPLDGFHKYKSELSQDQMEHRGRIDTFDLDKFKIKLKELNNKFKLKNDKTLYFPSFDHSIGDPIENDIEINNETEIIIIEGLYLFVEEMNCLDYFDIKIFLNTDLLKSMERVALRNYKAGISKTLEDSLIRTEMNDKINATYVLKNLQLNYNEENTFTINYI